MPTRKEILPDGRTKWVVSGDDALAAAMLEDSPEVPELSDEAFAALSEEMRKVREEEDAGAPEGG